MSSVFRILIRTVMFSRYSEDLAIWERVLGEPGQSSELCLIV